MMMDSKLNCLDPRKQELLEARFLGAKVSYDLSLDFFRCFSCFVCFRFCRSFKFFGCFRFFKFFEYFRSFSFIRLFRYPFLCYVYFWSQTIMRRSEIVEFRPVIFMNSIRRSCRLTAISNASEVQPLRLSWTTLLISQICLISNFSFFTIQFCVRTPDEVGVPAPPKRFIRIHSNSLCGELHLADQVGNQFSCWRSN